jgi:hypothetical protein
MGSPAAVKKGYQDNASKLCHNTYVLLKKYRDIVWSIELSVQKLQNDFEKEYGSSIENYLDTIYLAGAELSGSRLEYHSKCIDRSHQMIRLINQAIGVLRSKHKKGEAYYWILYYSFLSPQQLEDVQEIIDKLSPHIRRISYRSYYRKRQEAINELSTALWAYTSKDAVDILNEFIPEQ